MSLTAAAAGSSTDRTSAPAMRRWTMAWCAVVVLFGAILSGGAFGATDAAVHALLSLMGGVTLETLDRSMRFAFALMGAVTMGWGLTIAVAIDAIAGLNTPDARAHARRRLLGAVAIWFVVDSLLSIATGFALNAVSNAILMAGFVWLLRGWATADR